MAKHSDKYCPDKIMGFNLYGKHPVADLDQMHDRMSRKS